ncbi:hypothetical protein ACHAWO_012192 [Cyclotella atomus]|uniref:Leucine-rich repeat-containing N-terminal plant-type domain-containing protein n=1 Tax=Cyclotella atomus TaxID=382360 RepID=A0ABD3PD65_9STRA
MSDDEEARKKKHHKKSKSKSKSVEDAIEKKLREKKMKEKAAAAAEDALEAKIRAKQKAADGEVSSDEEEERERLSGSGSESNLARTKSGGSSKASKPKKAPAAAAAGPTDIITSPLFQSGGGDVRNRPAPNLAQTPEVDPLRAAEEAKKQNTRQVNQRYADLHETGAWGGLSKWEKYGLCLLALVAIGVAAGLGIKFANDARTDAPTGAPSISPTGSPSSSPTPMPTDETYRGITGLEAMKAVSPNLALRVDTPEELIGASTDPSATPQEIAAEFLLYDDELQIPARDPRFIERYALAVFYYTNGGCAGDWIDTTNWMNPKRDHCQWYGVVCDLQGLVTELAMEGNYVTGEMIMELSQLKTMSTMDLSNNRMEGQVSLDALNISSLFTLRLSNNVFSGDFPFDRLLEGSPLLSNLWIQENAKLIGEITDDYCSLFSITLDCDNFKPLPVYTTDGITTTFEAQCLEEKGVKPTEYTCNSDAGIPVTKPPSPTPANNNCGTPVVD